MTERQLEFRPLQLKLVSNVATIHMTIGFLNIRTLSGTNSEVRDEMRVQNERKMSSRMRKSRTNTPSTRRDT